MADCKIVLTPIKITEQNIDLDSTIELDDGEDEEKEDESLVIDETLSGDGLAAKKPLDENQNERGLIDESLENLSMDEKEKDESMENRSMDENEKVTEVVITDETEKEKDEAILDDSPINGGIDNEKEKEKGKKAADGGDEANDSTDDSFESASGSTPKRTPYWRRCVAAAELGDKESFERKLSVLDGFASSYGIEWPNLRELIFQLRRERTTVDMLSLEVTLWKKGYRRRK